MNRETLVELMLTAMSEHHSGNFAEAAFIVEAQLAAIEAAGVRLVPVLPTDQMLINAGTVSGYEYDTRSTADQDHIDWWTAMLASSPYATGDAP